MATKTKVDKNVDVFVRRIKNVMKNHADKNLKFFGEFFDKETLVTKYGAFTYVIEDGLLFLNIKK